MKYMSKIRAKINEEARESFNYFIDGFGDSLTTKLDLDYINKTLPDTEGIKNQTFCRTLYSLTKEAFFPWFGYGNVLMSLPLIAIGEPRSGAVFAVGSMCLAYAHNRHKDLTSKKENASN